MGIQIKEMVNSESSAGISLQGIGYKSLRRYIELKPVLYFLDFGVSIVVGWTAFGFSVVNVNHTLTWCVLTIIATFALYRAAMFTHELAHFHNNKMRSFRWFWNAVCGIPLLVPSFLYHGVHNEHHFRENFSTPGDGEYLPFGTPPRSRIVWYLLSNLLIPSMLIVRFAILGPLSWVVPRVRSWVWRRASSMSINFSYQRLVPVPTPIAWIVQESLCSIYVWVIALMLVLDYLPSMILIEWYIVGIFILIFNAMRTLAAHRYHNAGGSATIEEQIADSINITGGFILTPLLAPVGLRYHALHHLVPTIPYHNLGASHRHLMRNLSEVPAYQQTCFPNFRQAYKLLWRNAGRNITPP